ncbi:MAG: hypothetical protein EOO09_18935 [Chitinophagaceae bacterium]|nr:MAG: hypothetical protein EOO09_18935 [Chitinophagaceae bacterium]
MPEKDDQTQKPDNAEINTGLFRHSAELREKTAQTNRSLDELRKKAQQLLNAGAKGPDLENGPQETE